MPFFTYKYLILGNWYLDLFINDLFIFKKLFLHPFFSTCQNQHFLGA
jgi:hypothetical protein